MCQLNTLAGPPRKRQRTQKKGKLEKALAYSFSISKKKPSCIGSTKTMELEEKRRLEDMEHEESAENYGTDISEAKCIQL